MKFWRLAFELAEDYQTAIRLIYFARYKANATYSQKSEKFNLNYLGKKITFCFRPGTTDIQMFDEIFRRGMYQLPVGFCPQTIVDIGGNIGLASLYFALAFKNSTVHVFEPVPDNLEILKQNIEANRISNIIIHSYGLGKKDETMRFSLPEAGGFAGYSSEVKGDRSSIEVDIRDVRSVFDELGLHHIDLLKIDCEGAEVDLLHVLSDQFSQIDRIIGEIHLHLTGQKAGYSLIPLLCDTHSVDIKKNLGDNAFIFQAAKLP